MDAPVSAKIRNHKVLLFNPKDGVYDKDNQIINNSLKGLFVLSLKRVKQLYDILTEHPNCLKEYIELREKELAEKKQNLQNTENVPTEENNVTES